MSAFFTGKRFGLVVSLEMCGDMRTRELLVQRIAGGPERDRKLFVHAFWHALRAVNG